MKWTIAQEVIIARKLDLGLYDHFFNLLANYLNNGSEQDKSKLCDWFIQHDVQFRAPAKVLVDSRLNYAICSFFKVDSALALYQILEGTSLSKLSTNLEPNQQAKLNELSDAQLTKICNGKINAIIKNADFKKFLGNLSSVQVSACEPYKAAEDSLINFESTAFSNHYLAGPQEAESLRFKYSKLALTVDSYLNPDKAKPNQIKATSAHKNRVKKNKHKVANKNQAAVKEIKVPTGYRVEDDLPFSYFQPSNDSDFGFNILKNIDLFGLHLILVAQRRKFYFFSCNNSEFRSNFQALDSLSGDTIVSLHNKAKDACDEYQMAYKLANTANDWESRINLFKAYTKRNAALMVYADFYQDLFANLMVYQLQISRSKFWINSAQYFNYNDIYNPLLAAFSNATSDAAMNLLFGKELDKNAQALKGIDTQTIKKINSFAPMTVYSAGAFFSSTFDSVEDTHPMKVNFEPMVNEVLGYYESTEYSPLVLPVPIEEDPYKDSKDLGAFLAFVKDNPVDNDYESNQAFIFATDVKLNKHQNDCLMIFSYTCVIMDLIHRYMFDLLSMNDSRGGNPGLFNWYTFNYNDFEAIYPQYQELLNSPLLQDLLSSHNKLLELIILIQDLLGASDELYNDQYFAKVLKLTDNYDEELASAITNGSYVSSGHNISDKEQLIIDKACANFIKETRVFISHVQAFYEHPFPVLNELLSKLTDVYKHHYRFKAMASLQLSFVIDTLSRLVVAKLKTVPADLSMLKDESDHTSLELKDKFYSSIRDMLNFVQNRVLNSIIGANKPYWCYLEPERFKKYWPITSQFNAIGHIFNSNLISLYGMIRCNHLNEFSHDDEMRELYSNRLISNSICITLSSVIGELIDGLYNTLVCYLFKFIQVIRLAAIQEHHIIVDYLIYTIKQAHLMPQLTSKMDVLKSVTNNDINLVESEDFKDFLQTALKLMKPLVLLTFKTQNLGDLTKYISYDYALCNAKAIKHLLSDPYDFISNINIKYFESRTVASEMEHMVAIHPDYDKDCFYSPQNLGQLRYFLVHNNLEPVCESFFGKEITHALVTTHLDPDVDLSPIMSDYQCDKGTLRWVLNNCQQLHDEQVNAELMAIDLSKPNKTTALDQYDSDQDLDLFDENFEEQYYGDFDLSDFSSLLDEQKLVDLKLTQADVNLMFCYLVSSANTLLRNFYYAFENNLSLSDLKKIAANDQNRIDQSFAYVKAFKEIKQSISQLYKDLIILYHTNLLVKDNKEVADEIKHILSDTFTKMNEANLANIKISNPKDLFYMLVTDRACPIAKMAQDKWNNYNFEQELLKYLTSKKNTFSLEDTLLYVNTLVTLNSGFLNNLQETIKANQARMTQTQFGEMIDNIVSYTCSNAVPQNMTPILSIPEYKQFIEINVFAVLNAYQFLSQEELKHDDTYMEKLISDFIDMISSASVQYEMKSSGSMLNTIKKIKRYLDLDLNNIEDVDKGSFEFFTLTNNHLRYTSAQKNLAVGLMLGFADVLSLADDSFKDIKASIKEAQADLAKMKAEHSRSFAKKAETAVDPTEVQVEAKTKTKPKAKTTRSKVKKAEATVEPIEAKVEGETEAKPKAKTTRSKAKKAETAVDPTEAKVEVETEAKPKAKTTRSKAKKADAPVEPIEAIVEGESEAKPKAKTTRSKAKKAETPVEPIEAMVEVETEAKPKAKTTRSKAKKAAVEPTEAIVEGETEAKPKAKTTHSSKAKKAEATVEPIEAKVEVETEAKPKAKTTRSKAKKAEAAIETTEAKSKANTTRSKAKKAEASVEPTEAKPKAKSTRSKTKKADDQLKVKFFVSF